MHQAGGRISISIAGRRFNPRGRAVIKPAMLSHEANANHDGTVYRTTKAMPATAELSFDRGSDRFAWDSSFMTGFVDVTIVERDVGVTHLFTRATLVGEPSIDTETGEVSGLSIATDVYQKVNS